MRNATTAAPRPYSPPIGGAAAPRSNSVFDNFNSSIIHSIDAIHGLTNRVQALADQARGPIPTDGAATKPDSAPSTEGLLVGLERSIMTLQEAVGRLDNA